MGLLQQHGYFSHCYMTISSDLNIGVLKVEAMLSGYGNIIWYLYSSHYMQMIMYPQTNKQILMNSYI